MVSASASMKVVAAPHPLDEHALTRKKVADGPARQPARQVEAVGAQFDGTVGGHHPRIKTNRAASHLAFVLGAGRGEVDANHLRPELGQHDRRPNRAEDVGDGVADRNGVDVRLGLGGVAPQSIDLIRGDADRRRNGLRSGIESGGVARRPGRRPSRTAPGRRGTAPARRARR